MSLEVDPTYENGVLKLDEPLPFKDQERVIGTVKSKTSRDDESYGLIGWTGDPVVLRKTAENDEFGVLESL
jgi:predicted DNA-binding antitoxin AbrB/MazE fold protein